MKYREFINQHKDEMIEELKKFVSINSVFDKSTQTKEHPFGQGVANALDYVAKLGEKYGFEVDRCDGYCTELTIGSGDKMIGIFAHSDVVPATGEWNEDPFKPYVKDGKLYGRGTSDDKGPFVAAFYAVLPPGRWRSKAAYGVLPSRWQPASRRSGAPSPRFPRCFARRTPRLRIRDAQGAPQRLHSIA